jgi:hypothetical protein
MVTKMKLREVKRSVGALSTQQLVKLDAWIHGLLEGVAHDDGHSVIGKRHLRHKTYRRELVRCGKKDCKCAEGQLHGPYWYAYWMEGGRTKSQYIGKKLPRGVKAPKGSDER